MSHSDNHLEMAIIKTFFAPENSLIFVFIHALLLTTFKAYEKNTNTLFCSYCLFFCTGYHKDYSYEGGISPILIAIGSLKDSANNCHGIKVNGQYQPSVALTASNNIIVTVTITQPGTYAISTDTVNGYWFSDTGTLTKTGTQTVAIAGHWKANCKYCCKLYRAV